MEDLSDNKNVRKQLKCYFRKRKSSHRRKITNLYCEQVFHQYYKKFKFKGRLG